MSNTKELSAREGKITIRLPKEIKIAFRKVCKDELIDLSTKVRQMILEEIKMHKKKEKII